MSNWTHHTLTVTGPETERERFLAECFRYRGGKATFDFKKLIPDPEPDEGDELAASHIHRWRCEHWGTGDNACDTRVEREGEAVLLAFATTGALPAPIFNEVARRFPNLRIEGLLITEQCEVSGCSKLLCHNGNVAFEDWGFETVAA